MNWYKKAQTEDETLYHGTTGDFEVFEQKDVPHKKDAFGEGYYFTDVKKLAEQYAERSYIAGRKGIPHVKEVYLDINNPLRIKYSDIHKIVEYQQDLVNYAKRSGYDGVVITDLTEPGYDMGSEYIVFSPSQIKIK
tara:strand:+ start:9968 stop:10375 length:408 start_codon:yes stop_codon:yes gene_type:complete